MAKRAQSFQKNNKLQQKKFQKGGHSNSSTNPDRKVKGNTDGVNNSLRTKGTIKRLKMYNQKMPDQYFKNKIYRKKMHERPTDAPRIEPNRKWFGNVRTIDQKALQKLRIQMTKKQQDPTKIFVKAKKVPTSLLSEPVKQNKVRLLQVESYSDTFGPNKRRKRMKINLSNMEELIDQVQKKEHKIENDFDLMREDAQKFQNRDKRMSAGQSKRIWQELHKVVDSSDVLVQVLDARDPLGTRSLALQQHLKKNCPHKHIVLLINKADLVPVWVVAKWVKYLSKEYPTIAYKSSITNPFGKGSLINLFRQFDIFHRDKKNISIGFVGYPNVGKSSVINSLKERVVCKAAPIPGQTRVWQYITLTKRIYLIDCPGTVHATQGKSDMDSVLKGCVRAQKILDPTYYIHQIIQRVDKRHLIKAYGVTEWQDAQDFLNKLATKKGKLKKGGQPDVETTAKLIVIDWQRGELPFYHLPPGEVDSKKQEMNNLTLNQVKEEQFINMVGGQIQIIDDQDIVQHGNKQQYLQYQKLKGASGRSRKQKGQSKMETEKDEAGQMQAEN